MLAWNGILFNHESPRRGDAFVTRKVTKGIAAILAGKQRQLSLGNLEAKRDWGYAPEYVECMWQMLQQERAEDFVVGTGQAYSVKDFVEVAFRYAGLSLEEHVVVDPGCFRPTDPMELLADASKARRKLGWSPQIKFHDLVKIMVDADMRAAGLEPKGEGDRILATKFPHRWWAVD